MASLELLKLDTLDPITKRFSLSANIDRSFYSIIEYLRSYHKARTIIIEDYYIDKDYTNELSNFYSKTFSSRNGYCERLHFFRDEFHSIDHFRDAFSKGEGTYLGFMVKRPVAVGKVGRTIIRPKDFANFFHLCSIERDVHLLGNTIKAHGVPFIEQDSMVMTCAQAAMWMTAKYMHYIYSLPRQLPFDITEKSTSTIVHLGRTIPSSGLTIDQMMLV